MEYQIKSAKEAKVLEIFFDKNTNKLSYKNSKSIVTSIDTASDLTNIQADILELQNNTPTPATTKVYQANLTQFGTNAPTATVINNTLSAAIVWTRLTTGSYKGTLAGAFTNGVSITSNNPNPSKVISIYNADDPNIVYIDCTASVGGLPTDEFTELGIQLVVPIV